MGTYASAIFITVASLLLGRGLLVLCGRDGSSWVAAPVGFAALMIVCEVAVSLPGHGWTAVVVVVVLCVAATVLGWRRGARWPSVADGVPVTLGMLALTAVPFVANGRVGLLGVSILNDTHWHLILAQGLLNPSIQPVDGYGFGYPLGPHAVAAVFAQGLGSSVDRTFTGMIIATPILTALGALGALPGLPRTRRWLVAWLTGLPYLAAAWYVQAAFKEPIMALLLVGLIVVLQEGRREGFARPAAVIIPIAVLCGGAVYDYSYPGLVWPAAVIACWMAAEVVTSGMWRRVGVTVRRLSPAVPAVAIGALVLLLIIAPDLQRLHRFYSASGGTSVGTTGGVQLTGPLSLGNLPGPLHPLEGLGIWLTGDFRFAPTNALLAGMLSGIALLVLVFAVAAALDRREIVWPAALVGAALVYAYTRHSQSPYVAAKALVVMAPIVVLGSGLALMSQLDLARWRSGMTLALAVVSVAFFYLAFTSDYLVLADGQVNPVNHQNELRALRPLLHGKPTLVLFYDDYAQWELLGQNETMPQQGAVLQTRTDRPWAYGQPYQFDSVPPKTLDQYDYVIATRTNALSQPPPNFHAVGGSASFVVYRRVGPTPAFGVLPASPPQPGAVLDCTTATGRGLSRRQGYAEVRTPPVYTAVGPLVPNQSEPIVLKLPAGRWQLSLPYVSQQAVHVTGGGLDVTLPPNLDRPGTVWPVGTVTSTGAPITLTFHMTHPGLVTSHDPVTQYFTPLALVAAPPQSDQRVALRRACGRYVDWYQLTS
jgi:hypothetical protein